MESEAYQKMISAMEELKQEIVSLHNKANTPLSEKWLDNAELCQLLHISKRLLQSYRDEKMISYSQIGAKIYYKASDVEKFLKKYYQDNKQKRRARNAK